MSGEIGMVNAICYKIKEKKTRIRTFNSCFPLVENTQESTEYNTLIWIICPGLLLLLTTHENASTLQYLLYVYFPKLLKAAKFGS